MASFEARLRVPGKARLPIVVLVEVTKDEILFTSGGNSLAVWSLSRTRVEVQSDGFHLTLDSKEIVLTVAEPARFASALGLGNGPGRSTSSSGGIAVLSERKVASSNDLSIRLEGISPEEKFAGVIERVDELRAALIDSAVPPEDFFARWLSLLKEINRRHGQGAMPTPLFYRLNTELLELLPAPTVRRPSGVTVDV